MKVQCPAKINLTLKVTGKRPDGFHNIESIMQTISLYDYLTIDVEKSEKFEINLSGNSTEIPYNEKNLVYKAVMLFIEKTNLSPYKIDIYIDKNIPVAAGLAGGSTDAAAAFVAMNKLFDLGLTEGELMKLGVRIGADVPYCIMQGTALSEGIGEILTGIAPMPDCYIAIAKPPVSVSTKWVYQNLKASELERHPDIDGMVAAWSAVI